MGEWMLKCLAAVGLVTTCAMPSLGDVVVLTDGSRLVGAIGRLGEGKLTIETQFAGTLKIDAGLVASMESDQKLVVGMASGDRLVGPIHWSEDTERCMVMTQMGGIPVEMDKIEAVWPQGDKSPEVLAMEEQLAQTQAEYEKKKPKWSATLEAGVDATQGNSDTLEARGRVELRRQSEKDLLKFWVWGDYAEENDKRSVAEVRGGSYYEYLFTERLFAFVSGELEYDEFEELDLRVIASAGPGYYWIKKPEHELKTRVGISYMHESFFDDRINDTAQLEVGLDYRLDIAPWLQFTENAVYYPTFDGIDDYRLVSNSAFVIPLGKSDAWKLKLGALYEYKSQPPPDVERLDQTYYANIVLDLK